MPYTDPTVFPWLALVLGLVLGSFYNVCIHRAIEGQSLLWPPSHCPHCAARLRPWHLVPILSYLALRGRCHACGQRISPRYPIVEAASGLLALLLALRFGATWPFAVYMVFGGALLVASFIDFETFILPDVIILTGAVAAPVAAILLLDMPLADSLIGAVAGGGTFWLVLAGFKRVRGIDGMGLGDVKLMALIGGLCGWQALPVVTLLAGLLALLAAVWFLRRREVGQSAREVAIPFGPFLSLGAVVYMLYGPALVRWWFGVVTGKPI
ncbi:A24 family peptidase [Nitratidesulfovibrio sp.]|uniref:prepilin peptidase n=1 Tax=Nitratidesulfovibrio sp. TaxID=2802297 RepID=UPI0033421C30